MQREAPSDAPPRELAGHRGVVHPDRHSLPRPYRPQLTTRCALLVPKSLLLRPPPLIESRVLLARVPARIAEHRRCTECVAARLMSVPVYPRSEEHTSELQSRP